MTRKREIRMVDLFCGAGGSSSGMKRAASRLRRRLHMTVINHWQCAIQTHRANHPDVEHLCDSLEEIDPRKVVPDGRLDLLWASPECIGFSNAAGGVPRTEQSRTGAWRVRDWAAALEIPLIIVENIREFQKWKPLTKAGRPDRRYSNGHTFRRWIGVMEALGYQADWRMLRSADFGDPTTRERLFVVFRKGGPVRWPRQTHSAAGNGKVKRWVPARRIIDWAVPGESIFTRKRPLRPKTLARIAAGLRKFAGPLAEPFLVMLYGTGSARSVDRPLPTVTAKGKHIGLCEPFIIQTDHGGAHGPQVRSVDKPLVSVTQGNGSRLVQPFLVNYHGNHEGKTDGDERVQDLDKPLPTQDTSNRYGLCEPFISTFKGRSIGRTVDEPLPTMTSQNCHALVEPFISEVNHGSKGAPDGEHRTHDIDEPVPPITSKNGHALVEPFLVKYNGTGGAVSADEPLHTISTKARFGLVEIDGQPYRMDIRFRMLLVRELARAMGFAEDYEFHGTKADQIRQIGNAVSVGLASELCYCNLRA